MPGPHWEPTSDDAGEADTPIGVSPAPAHHHPPVASDLERSALDAPAEGACLTMEDLAAEIHAWPVETLLARKHEEEAHAGRAEVIALLDRELAARVSGAAPSQAPR